MRIWIREISPQIWRRLLVRSDSTIAQLHDILQIAFGWTDEHLHQFLIRDKPYGIWKPGGISFCDNPHQMRLRDFHFRCKERWVYEYDLTTLPTQAHTCDRIGQRRSQFADYSQAVGA